METNEVVLFTAPERVTVEERPVPEPKPNEVLVRTSRSLVSIGTELTILSGKFPPGSEWAKIAKYPFAPGYCNVGEIVEMGNEVNGLELGQRVGTWGDHARYATSKVTRCRPLPEEVPDSDAAFFTLVEIVMNGMRRSRLTWGETVAVFGLGLLGQLAVRVALAAGAQRVYGVDVSDRRLSMLPDSPRVRPLRADQVDPAQAIEADSGSLVDVAFELTGRPDAIPQQVRAVRVQGRYVVLSSPTGPTTFDFHDWCNYRSLEIIGAHNSSHPEVATPQNPWTMNRHSELYFEYLKTGAIEVESLISHQVPYTEAPEIYAALLEDRSKAMGVIFEW